jgi:hypothetical protein
MTLDEIVEALNGLSEDERRKVIEASSPDNKTARYTKVVQEAKDNLQRAYAHVLNELVNPWEAEVLGGNYDAPQPDSEKIAEVFREGLKG